MRNDDIFTKIKRSCLETQLTGRTIPSLCKALVLILSTATLKIENIYVYICMYVYVCSCIYSTNFMK